MPTAVVLGWLMAGMLVVQLVMAVVVARDYDRGGLPPAPAGDEGGR